jgi:hypothetical protein
MTDKKQTIYTRLLDAQMEIGAIKKDSDNPFFKSKYFDINALLKEVKPVLNKHGLLLNQPIVIVEGKNALKTIITEVETGAQIESVCFLPDGLDPQKTGSAVSYFRRYELQSTLGLEAEDDDANVASGKKVANKVAEDDLPF